MRQEEGIEKGDKEEDIRQTREPINTDDRRYPSLTARQGSQLIQMTAMSP